MMNWNKKDVNTQTETEQEPRKLVKEDKTAGLSSQERGLIVAGLDEAAGIWPFVPCCSCSYYLLKLR